MDYVKTVKQVFAQPTEFFTKLRSVTTYKDAFVYLLLISLVYAILSMVFGMLGNSLIVGILSPFDGEAALGHGISTFLYPFISLGSWVIGLGMSFVFAGITHVWLKLWGGKASYVQTYAMMVYASTPGYLLGWSPFIGAIAWVYTIVLSIIGAMQIHRLSLTLAILAFVLPVVLLIGFFFVILMAFIGSMAFMGL